MSAPKGEKIIVFRRDKVDTLIKNIVPQNPKRRVLAIVNLGSSTIYISEKPEKVVEEGMPLHPGVGVSFEYADGDRPDQGFFAQSANGVQEISIYEVMEI